LLKILGFSARIAELAEAAAQGAVMAAREVLVELSRIAHANMADFVRAFFGCDDPVAAVDQLTPAQTAALAEVTVEQFTDGRGERAREARRIRFKLVSKIDALELLGKHHKLYVERREHDVGAGLADRLAAALARVDGETRSDIEAKAARLEGTQALRPPRPTDRRRRSPRAMRSARRQQIIARKVQKVARLK
jgi:Terminase small subunit